MDVSSILDLLINVDRWTVLVTIVFILLALVVWFVTKRINYYANTNIPVCPGYPLIGNLPELLSKGDRVFDSRMIEAYKNVVGYFIGLQPIIVVTNPAIAEFILVKDFKNFRNREIGVRQRPPMDSGLLSVVDDDWKRIRSTLSPTFTSGKLKQMMDVMDSCVDTMICKLSERVDENPIVDVYRIMGTLTADVILRTAFGVQFPVHGQQFDKLAQEVRKALSFPRGLRLMNIFGLPMWVRKHIGSHFFGKDMSFFINILKPIIHERAADEQNLQQRKDLLQLMLSSDVEGLPKLTENEVIAQAVTFLLAGYDTTSNLLAYTLYLLTLHPDAQEKLYQEVTSSSFWSEHVSKYDELSKMQYLDQVVCESLRIFPPAQVTVRTASKDIDIQGYLFPKGCLVKIPIHGFHHSPRFWDEPEEFRPERFAPDAKTSIASCSFVPFGQGPRSCIGTRFAHQEAKLALARMVMEFKFERCPETEVPLSTTHGLVSSPQKGVFLRVKKRIENTWQEKC